MISTNYTQAAQNGEEPDGGAMRLLPEPPSANLTEDVIDLLGRSAKDPTLQAYIAEANREYYHWEKLRHRPTPKGISPEQAWRLVKWTRLAQRRPLPVQDVKGRAFSYWLPDEAQAVLHEVDLGSGTTLAVGEGTPASLGAMRGRLIVSSLMEEAIATSQIEGAVTTRKVAKEMLRTNRRPRNRSEQMIVNSYRTIQFLRDRLEEPLSIDLLSEIQASMTRDTLDDPTASGRLRAPGEDIAIVDARDNEVVFVPPPAELLLARLENLVVFANAPGREPFIHPLVKAAVLHFWLAYEHPFVDGNGRTARALFYWFMLKSGYWLFEFLTISRIILAAPAQYYRSFLYSEQDDNDLTYSVLFQLRATQRALQALRKYLAAKQAEQQRMAAALRKFPGLNHRQRALIDHALTHPDHVYTFQSHQRSHGISRVTARNDLLGLVERGLLTPSKSGKQREFLVPEDLAAQLDPPRPTRRGSPTHR
jgi:Fic family protein